MLGFLIKLSQEASMKYRFSCTYLGRPEDSLVFELDNEEVASQAAQAMVQHREHQGGYKDYSLVRIDQEEKTTTIPIADQYDGPSCETCGTFTMRSGSYWKCTKCGSTTSALTTISP